MTARMVFSVAGLLAALAPSAQAQYPYSRPATSPYQQPAFNPYLNLLRPGGNAFTNYYGFVRPQLDFAADIGQLGQQQALIQQNVTALDQTTGQLVTGVRSTFMTHRRYFMNNGSGGVVTGGGGAGSGASRGLGAGAGAQRGGMGGGAQRGGTGGGAGLGTRGY
jgi:hypothetical protein